MTPPETPQGFYTVTNRQVYEKIQELEMQVTKITTIYSVVAFIVAPVISVVLSVVATQLIGNPQ